MRSRSLWIAVAALVLAQTLSAQGYKCEDQFKLPEELMAQYQYGPQLPPPPPEPIPEPPQPDSLKDRIFRYAELALKHRMSGLASYYSGFFHGRKTANGERFRNDRYSAAHLTLPLGCWVEVTARATGRKLRLRVNDRGPYVKKFALDLSQAAAKYLGVDRAPDRYVDIRIIAMPGEEPLPDDAPLDTDVEALTTLAHQ